MVLEAQQPGRRAGAAAEVAGAEHRDAGRRRTEQEQEHVAERVAANVERQIRQADRQHQRVGRLRDAEHGNGCQRDADQRAEREQHAAYDEHAAGPRETRDADDAPGAEQR